MWPWMGAAALMLASIVVPITSIRAFWIVPVSTILLVPPVMLVMMGVITPAVLRNESLSEME